MTHREGPIYEVSAFVDGASADDYDVWLAAQVREMLRLVAIADCQVFAVPGDSGDRQGRVCQYLLETEAALDEFIDGPGADIEAETASAFGDRVTLRARVLREDPVLEALPDAEQPNCLNCGTRLRGQYCGNCGQRSRSRLISLWELVSDAFGDLFELDSRLWQTLKPLVARPGLLTHDYLQGRRARYMPPFRMYLVLSLVFFLVAFFDPRGDLTLVTETEPEQAAAGDDAQSVPESVLSESELVRQEILDELAREGVVAGDGRRADEQSGDCNITAADMADVPGWLQGFFTPGRVQHICERIMVDDGRAFAREILDNVPAALIVLLPLMAFVLKVLYPLSRRYYVEHLLFFVHYHAFFFLVLTLEILFARLAALLQVPDAVAALVIVVASFYIPVYLFVAMRRVYGQGRLLTFLKYVVLLAAYLAGFTVTMLGAFAIAALSI